MFRRSKEYSLEELLEHPVLGMQMTSEGIDRRCLDLMFDTANVQHRFAEGRVSRTICRFICTLKLHAGQFRVLLFETSGTPCPAGVLAGTVPAPCWREI